MNQRIKELAEQAGWMMSDEVEGFNIRLEKFTQLVVKECANAIADDDLAKDCGTFLMDSYAKGMRYSAEKIKEHFGVEQ